MSSAKNPRVSLCIFYYRYSARGEKDHLFLQMTYQPYVKARDTFPSPSHQRKEEQRIQHTSC